MFLIDLRTAAGAAAIVGLVLAPVAADVKTRERTQVTFGGMLGGLLNRASGQGADGVTSTVAVRGTRKASMNDRTGEIIDLAEEKVYEIDLRRKEYRVTTFAEMRERLRQAQAEAERQARDMPAEGRPDPGAGREMEVEYDVKETGATRTIAGHPARQVIVTVTMREKGRTLEEGGGMVLTSDMWLGPEVPALKEIQDFDLRYAKAVYGEALPALRQLGAMTAMYPGMQQLMERAQAESDKLTGTPLMTTLTIEAVRRAAQPEEASAQRGGGGGIGGALAGRLARRMAGGRSEPRSTLVTSVHELLAIDASASDADVAMPAGFRERR